MKKLSLLLAAFCLFSSFAVAQMSFAPEVKRVAVFKNGYAFTYREAEAETQNGWAYTLNAPTGVLGTVWGYSTVPNVRVSQLLASETERRETVRVVDIAEVLLANEGSRIRFIDSYNKEFEGTYQIIGRNRLNLTRSLSEDDIVQADNLIIALKTQTGTIMFPVNSVRNIEIIGSPKMEKTRAVKENRLMMRVDGAKDGERMNLGIAALERGIRWIPAYRVEVKGTPIKEAKLELEAMLINELTDLKNTEVNFVVGVPHFLFQEQMSPLSMNTAFAGVSSYFQAGSRNSRRDSYSNAIMSQVASNNYSTDGGGDEITASPTVADEEQTTSFSAEQLYLYKTDNINLKKGERASLRLFSLTVPATEVFEWTLGDAPDQQARYMGGNYSEQQALDTDLSNKIWYALRLKNQTGMPWTTAPALSFRDWKPLGQDMMTFTPIGGENILRVTPATELVGTHKLEEKSRVKTQLRYGGGTYEFDLVTVEGLIKLRNIKKDAVEVVLTRNVVGEVTTAGDNGKISREGLNLQSVNPNSIIKWNLNLPSGEKEIRYTYKIYVRK